MKKELTTIICLGKRQRSLAHNVISLGEVTDFGKIKFKLKNKYDAKRERE